MTFNIELQNSGTATAKDLYIVVQTDDTFNFFPGTDWARGSNPLGQVALKANKSVHPGELTHVLSADFRRKFPNRTVEPTNNWEIVPHFEKVCLKFLVYAEAMQSQQFVVAFTPDEFDYTAGLAMKEGVIIL